MSEWHSGHGWCWEWISSDNTTSRLITEDGRLDEAAARPEQERQESSVILSRLLAMFCQRDNCLRYCAQLFVVFPACGAQLSSVVAERAAKRWPHSKEAKIGTGDASCKNGSRSVRGDLQFGQGGPMESRGGIPAGFYGGTQYGNRSILNSVCKALTDEHAALAQVRRLLSVGFFEGQGTARLGHSRP